MQRAVEQNHYNISQLTINNVQTPARSSRHQGDNFSCKFCRKGYKQNGGCIRNHEASVYT